MFIYRSNLMSRNIVSKIEELFSEIDKGGEELKAAQEQLKVYRQAVLKWAFEGKLTNEDIKDNELPFGWKWVKIGYLLSDTKRGMATGPFGTMLKKHEHQTMGVPVLGIENIGEGIFQMPNKVFVSREKADELKSFTVEENDVIISRSGTVGEICLIPPYMKNSIISTNLIRVRLNKEVIDPKYFVYLFQGGYVRQQVFDLCKGSSRAFLNQTK
jgi:type I restriction enzyme S subunit